MGYGRYSPDDWQKVTRATAAKSTAQNFTSRHMQDDLNPLNITVRESRDSTANPKSTPIIIAADVTGSMGELANIMLKQGCATLTTEMYNRKPVTDPHLMFMAVGDVAMGDRAPLQMTQFEADIRIAEQLTRIYVEGNGGGNGSESYHLPWYAAALKTKTDSFQLRKKKGLLITYGDESVPPPLTPQHIKTVFGDSVEQTLSARELLTMAEREWDVFHLIIMEGGNMQWQNRGPGVIEAWNELLGERAIKVSDHTKMPEIIVSLAQVIAGEDVDAVASSWSGDTSLVVADAIKGMSRDVATSSAAGVRRF